MRSVVCRIIVPYLCRPWTRISANKITISATHHGEPSGQPVKEVPGNEEDLIVLAATQRAGAVFQNATGSEGEKSGSRGLTKSHRGQLSSP